MAMTDIRERARGALYGLAIGDALGMPTQLLSPEEVIRKFGRLGKFEPADDDHPIAAGMPADLLGPSTKSAVAAILAGAPVSEAGRHGTTNGAAMRVAPIGIAVESGDLSTLVDRVVEASAVTHNTGIALAGASAVAAAVSAGIDGADVSEAIDCGIAAARIGRERGHWAPGASIHRRIELATSLADPLLPDVSLRNLRELIGTSLATQESVPMAFGILAMLKDSPWDACLAAAAQGGDSDTIAAMVGAIGGACHGVSGFPPEAVATIRSVNNLDLDAVADRLLELRGVPGQ